MKSLIVLFVSLALVSSCAPSEQVEREVSVAQAETPPGVDGVLPLVRLSEGQTKRVRLAPLERASEVPRTLLATGTVELRPGGVAVLSAAILARVSSVDVEPGQRVKQGQKLIGLDASAVAVARAEVKRGEALQARAEQLVEQERQLEALNATSQRDSSLARQQLAVAQADLDAARGNLRAWGAAGAAGSSILLRAPMDGVVTHLEAMRGGVVDAGAALVRVVDPTALSLRVLVRQSDMAQVAPRQAQLRLVGADEFACAAQVLGHLHRVDTDLRAIPFRLQPAPECAEWLLEGAAVEVLLPLKARVGDSDLASAPASAISSHAGKPIVFFAVEEGSFQPRFVSDVETWSGRSYFRVSGLPSRPLVVSGTILLKGELMRAELE